MGSKEVAVLFGDVCDSTTIYEAIGDTRAHALITQLLARLDEGVKASAGTVVKTLGDMPFVRPTTIAAVRDALAAGAPLAAPYFRARRGHPVALSRKFLKQLLALKGDEGAKALVAESERALVKIPVGDPGVIRDIDTPDDLAPPLRI